MSAPTTGETPSASASVASSQPLEPSEPPAAVRPSSVSVGASTQPPASVDTSDPGRANPATPPPPKRATLQAAQPSEVASGSRSGLPCERSYTRKQNYQLVVAGDVITGVGGAAFVVAALGVALAYDRRASLESLASNVHDAELSKHRRELEGEARSFTVMGIVSGSVAAALLGTGIPLIVIGHRRERLRSERARIETPELSFRRESDATGRRAGSRVDLGLTLRF